MKRASYREQDYAFGQIMLSLRSAIGLTQAGLAIILEVSRQSVAEWEAGSKYPKVKHLQAFIALAVQHQAFPPGREADEIRLLWKAAHQKVLLDEAWLTKLLALRSDEMISLVTQPHSTNRSRFYWDDALALDTFYGRQWELNLLTEWVVNQSCRVVSVLGLGGIGKSALTVNLTRQSSQYFDVVIWRSLRDSPPCEVLLDDLLKVLAPSAVVMSINLEQRLSLLLEYLAEQRVLLVLDNLETLMEEGEGTGRMRPGYESYAHLFRRVAETDHRSCLLLTSREKSNDLALFEGSHSSVRSLLLTRLDADSCQQLLAEKGVVGSLPEYVHLIEAYTGNPLALKIVSQTVVDLFGGEIAPFLEQGEVIFGGVRALLSEQFMRLSSVEQTILLWLAILREPTAFKELLVVMVTPAPRARLMEAMEALHRRSLIERGQKPGSFTLQSVVLEYLTTRLIDIVSREIDSGQLDHLMQYGLELAQASEYVRQTQDRLILSPILTHLRGVYIQPESIGDVLIERLNQVRTLTTSAQGYAPANLIALLRALRGHLRGLDLSRLLLRGGYLQGIEMQDTMLSDALIQDSVFTHTIDAMREVAISSTGEYWAASGRHGDVWMWTTGGRNVHRTWRAHADMVWALAFSADGRILASGSWDGAVKVWDSSSGRLLWSGQHSNHVNAVAFSPVSNLLASGGNDTTVRLWDRQSGTQLKVLPHPVSVLSVIWSPDGHLLASGDVDGIIRLWEIDEDGSASCSHTIESHRNSVEGLAFSADGTVLASGSWDSSVKLWDVHSGQMKQMLNEPTDRVTYTIAWSPDGRTLASAGRDQTIWLWDVKQGNSRKILHAHTGGVYGLAFTPDSHNLVSVSEDGTLRVWDVISGQCVRAIQGYSASFYDVNWSPDGAELVTGGSDGVVTVFDVAGRVLPRLLRGHHSFVMGVGWSSDGRWLASSEWENAIRLWDITSDVCIRVLQHPADIGNSFCGLTWSPKAQRLANATYGRGILIWNMTGNTHDWAEHQFPTWIRHIAWNPDGTHLAGGGEDGVVYVWNVAEDDKIRYLAGHHGMIISVAWSPDGTRLASAGSGANGGELFIWDVQREERTHSFAGHLGSVSAVAWGNNGELLVSGDTDGMLRWWDVQSGACLWFHEAHQGMVHALRRSPDGYTLASCGGDGAIMIWDLQRGNYLQTLRRDRPYERLDITGIRGLTEAQKVTLLTLGAVEDVVPAKP